eukprot:TRINITY_DN7955_c0_g2_i2.p1 TRINITY_DN7955_c0_g2~~TRINITY_DN7955_c0_g2_i2.p1  ORF type:complete len:237 (+),score=26.90 TRINITY_DN7955_c0_g2_i2:94-711(+)
MLQGLLQGLGLRASPVLIQRRWRGVTDRAQNKGAGFVSQKKALGNRSEKATFPVKIRNAGIFVNLGDMRMKPLYASASFERVAESPFYDFNKLHYPELLGQKRQRAIVKKLVLRSPRRPNSGKPLCAEVTLRRPSIRTGEPVPTTFVTRVGDKSAPVREYSILVSVAQHVRGLSVRFRAERGEFDFPAQPTKGNKAKKWKAQLGY